MQTYEHPDTHEKFLASTPEHAAARVFGGKPGDYIATKHTASEHHPQPWAQWIEVFEATHMDYMDDIYLVD